MILTKTLPELIETAIDQTNLEVRDINDEPENMLVANNMVIEAYKQYSNQELSTEVIQTDIICESEIQYCQHTIGIFLKNSEDILLGSIRFIVGSKSNSFEFAKLISPPHIYASWNEFSELDFNPSQAIELGRLCLSLICLSKTWTDRSLHLLVLNHLVSGAYRIAEERYKINQAWSVVAKHVARAIKKSGIGLKEINCVRLKSHANQELFARYDRYWDIRKIGFYKVLPNLNSVEHLNNSAIREINTIRSPII